MLKIIAFECVFNTGANTALIALGSAILSSSAFGFNRCAIATFVNSHPDGMLYR